jgi:MFS family permease
VTITKEEMVSSAFGFLASHARTFTARAELGTLGLAVAAMFASGPGQSFLIAVFVDEMLSGTGLSRAVFSILYAAGTVVSALAMLQMGRVADRFGLRVVWVVASVGLAGACLLAGAARGVVLAFFALALLRTFGQGSLQLVATLLVARTFRARRGQAMAVASLGLTAASVLLPPLAVWLILELGWRAAYRVLGLALIVLVLPLAVFVRGGVAGTRAAGVPRAAVARRSHPRAMRSSRLLPRFSVPSPRARRLLFVVAAPPFVLTAVIFHSVSVLSERGLSFEQAGFALGLLGIASVTGTLAGGWLSDRTRTRTLLSAMTALLLLATIVLLVPAAPAAYLGILLLGVAGGVFGVVSGIVWPRTYGLTELGRLQGTASSVQIAAAAIGPLPLAISETATGAYFAGLLVLAVYSACALIVAIRWRDPRVLRHPR